MEEQNYNTIISRNTDVEHIVNAAAKYGLYGRGQMTPKRLALLVIADVHRCKKQMESAIEYLSYMDAIDAGISLGDMQGSRFNENDGRWYTDAVARTKKPFYTIIGNHDGGNSEKAEVSGSRQELFDKFIAPTREQMRMQKLEKSYYAVNFHEYGISMIFLNNYDVPDERTETGDFLVSRGVDMIGQEQADWLIKTLAEIPRDYHLFVVRHSSPERFQPIACDWTQQEFPMGTDGQKNVTSHLVNDVIDAWINGKKLEREYASENYPMITPVKVKADFTERGCGIFAAYLVGHSHIDWIGTCEKYPEQKLICFPSAANDGWQNFLSDLPRTKGTKAEDCITVLTVDTQKRCIYLVRVGSNITVDMKQRIFTAIQY